MQYHTPLQKFLNPPVPTGKKYAQTFGDGILDEFPIQHDLGTQDVIVQVREANDPQDVVACDIRIVDPDNILLSGFEDTPVSGSLRVVVF